MGTGDVGEACRGKVHDPLPPPPPCASAEPITRWRGAEEVELWRNYQGGAPMKEMHGDGKCVQPSGGLGGKRDEQQNS